jgi:hypothetical protein
MNKSNMLDIPCHSSKFFTYNREDQSFVTEASDMGIRAGQFLGYICDQVWNDACDIGFWLESSITGVKKLFTFDGEDKSGEDIAGWRFNCYDKDGKVEYKALVIND